MSSSQCRACGKSIVWMKTKAGKSMPCDARFYRYRADENGSQRILNHSGEIIKCELVEGQENATGFGYMPHFATCPNADNFRKRGKKK